MNRKAKIIATLSTLGMAIAMLVFSVYAATSATFKVTTNVSFVATKHVKATITARDTEPTSTELTKDSTYSKLASQGADQTISVNANGETVDGSNNKIDGLQDVEFAAAELTQTNKYYGYQIKVTNNDTQNSLPISVTAQNQTRQGYTVTFDGATTTTIASGATHIITCILEITDLAGNSVTITNSDLALDVFLGEEQEEDYPEATLDYLTFELADSGDYYKVAIDGNKIEAAESFDGNIVIPAYNEGKPVKEIIVGSACYSGVTSVILPNTLEVIGREAFMSFQELEYIKLPTGLKIIEANAFDSCSLLNLIILPEGVESIGSYAFSDSEGAGLGWNQREVVIPKSVVTVAEYGFSNCIVYLSYDSSLSIPDGWNENWGSGGVKEYSAVVYYKDQWSMVDGVPTPNA